MDIKRGDKVRFFSQVGEAKVIKIIDKNTVLVLDDNDFEVPCDISDLVVIKSDLVIEGDSMVSEHIEPEELEKKKEFKNKVFLAFVSKNPGSDGADLDAFIVNDTCDTIYFTFYKNFNGSDIAVGAGEIQSGRVEALENYKASQLNDISSFTLQYLRFSSEGNIYEPNMSKMEVKHVKFFKSHSFKSNDYFENPAILCDSLKSEIGAYKLNDLSPSEEKHIKAVKKVKNNKSIFVVNTSEEVLEIDLHINKLIDSVVGLSNRDILQYQIDKFEETINNNINKKGKKIVFIHGIGNGTLKKKLLTLLSTKYKKLNYQDASFQKYGPGATMVVI